VGKEDKSGNTTDILADSRKKETVRTAARQPDRQIDPYLVGCHTTSRAVGDLADITT
jgi:hypothetical protein